MAKNPPVNAGDTGVVVQSLGREDSLEKEMAIYSSILIQEIPWTEESDGLQSMGSQRVGHDRDTNAFTFSHFLKKRKMPHLQCHPWNNKFVLKCFILVPHMNHIICST